MSPLYTTPLVTRFEGWDVASGESSVPKISASSNAIANTSGTLRLVFMLARKTETIGSVRLVVGGVAASGLTLCRVGIYSIASNGDGTLIASTPNDTGLLTPTASEPTKALSASFLKTAGSWYAVGILQVGTTTANLQGGTGAIAARMARANRANGLIASQTDLPSSFTDAGLTSTATFYLIDLIP